MDNQDKEVQIGKYKVKVVRNLCIGAAACVGVSPITFELDQEKKAIIREVSDKEGQIISVPAFFL